MEVALPRCWVLWWQPLSVPLCWFKVGGCVVGVGVGEEVR